MKTKKFDAVEFMRKAREKMGADMRDLTFAEQLAYIEQRAAKVRREIEARRESSAA
ncbi:MAG TPA: hypothetical protein VGS22_18955 [Thermoanaerobaculia bacterium]|jgi:hypothetical protein|nr:hypothetical protein [Thermoanaerobaculia bacterium]